MELALVLFAAGAGAARVTTSSFVDAAAVFPDDSDSAAMKAATRAPSSDFEAGSAAAAAGVDVLARATAAAAAVAAGRAVAAPTAAWAAPAVATACGANRGSTSGEPVARMHARVAIEAMPTRKARSSVTAKIDLHVAM